jgi:hypothetical protein
MTETSKPEPSQENLASAREVAAARLAEQATRTLTLDEYTERAAAIEQAATADELDAAMRELGEKITLGPPPRHVRWLVGVLGGTNQRGRWRLSSRLRIVAVLGGTTLDLGQARPEAPESVITIAAFLGGVEVIAPPGVTIELSGVSLLGGRSDERSRGPSLIGSPVIRLRAFALLGGVKVKDRSPRRKPLDAIRRRRSEWG